MGDRPVSEEIFGRFTELALTIAEPDLRARIEKLQERHGGPPPGSGQRQAAASPQNENDAGRFNRPPFPQEAMPGSPMKYDYYNNSLAGSPVGSPQPFRHPQQQSHPMMSPGNNTHSNNDLVCPPQQVQVPLSAQQLQEYQRQQAEQEQKLQQMLREKEARERSVQGSPPPHLAGSPPQLGRGMPAEYPPQPPSWGNAQAQSQQHQNMQSSPPNGGQMQHGYPHVVQDSPQHSLQGKSPPGSFCEEDEMRSCVVSDKVDIDKMRGLHAPSETLEDVKNAILNGKLRVSVFNKHLQLEPKRLALNPKSRRISILRDDGLCEDSWEVDKLRCVTEGIASTILTDPPPQDRCMAFRFMFPEAENEDRFLCVVLDNPGGGRLATEAFSQLCGVPIAPSAA